MGNYAQAQICYGILFEEDYEFPWDADKYDGDIEEWWLDTLGYKTRISTHTPISLVNGCRSDYPRYILAIPESKMIAEWGDPLAIDPQKLAKKGDYDCKLLNFCEEHGIKTHGTRPQWYLSALLHVEFSRCYYK